MTKSPYTPRETKRTQISRWLFCTIFRSCAKVALDTNFSRKISCANLRRRAISVGILCGDSICAQFAGAMEFALAKRIAHLQAGSSVSIGHLKWFGGICDTSFSGQWNGQRSAVCALGITLHNASPQASNNGEKTESLKIA